MSQQPWVSRVTASFAVLAFVAVAASNCSDAETSAPGPGGMGGSADGGGGEGGSGGATGCDDCGGDTPICVDDTCVSACPGGRAACTTSAESQDPTICCEAGDQCCTAADNGYEVDQCQPATEGCPIVCPDGLTQCSDGEFCLLDAGTGGYSCIASCDFQRVCDAITCCPIGTRCDAGACGIPDLTIDAPRIATSARMERRNFEPNSCEIVEGCVQGSGDRTLLRFDLETPNIGEFDLVLGDPGEQTDLFEYSPCHNHFHFNSYADYSLEDADGNVVAVGHKQAFCLLDWRPYLPGAPQQAAYDCSFQGIQAGWSDVYGSGLPCQWVDVTDVPPGDYKLRVRVNFDQILTETDYTNNEVLVDVQVLADSCQNGCRDYDPTCCNAANTCGLSGDGFCDCFGTEPWDVADCGNCLDCPAQTSCHGGCTPNSGPDCTMANPANLQNNGVCDCGGAFVWDFDDCSDCVSSDPDCPSLDTCPNGCSTGSTTPECCADGDPCGIGNDGWCDCGGAYADTWDYVDCSSCGCN